jgi:CubicO group peptidase (beta-lactamase class C family)
VVLVLLLPGGAELRGQAGDTVVPPPAPWALREEFDPNVIPGFAAWFQRSVDRVMEEAVSDSVTPGAWVVVGHRGEVVLSRGYGTVGRGVGAAPVSDSTLWDLASVTKGVATTLSAMALVEEGRLDPDRRLHAYLDGWPREGPRGRITVRHLLEHTSGLPAGLDPAEVGADSGDWVSAAARVPLVSPPGREELYSDLGAIVLGRVVEAVAGQPLDRYADARIFAPLGLRETGFRPLEREIPAARIVPTGRPEEGARRGRVHDPSARALGGVAGHAGVFASARDLAALASALLWERPRRVVCRDLLREFTRREGRASRFGTGWEMPAEGGVWSEMFEPRAFGHTGFTGTSFWVDPDRDLFVILLTSRLDAPDPGEEGHLALRRALHGVVSRAQIPPDPGADAGGGDRRWASVDSCRAEQGHALVAELAPWIFARLP